MVVVDAATRIGIREAIGNGQAGDGDAVARGDVEDAASGVAVHGHVSGTGAVDEQIIGDEQLARGQRDGAVGAGSEVNGVDARKGIGIRNGLAQAAGAIVVRVHHAEARTDESFRIEGVVKRGLGQDRRRADQAKDRNHEIAERYKTQNAEPGCFHSVDEAIYQVMRSFARERAKEFVCLRRLRSFYYFRFALCSQILDYPFERFHFFRSGDGQSIAWEKERG